MGTTAQEGRAGAGSDQTSTQTSGSRRAALLADRIEQGAAFLAAFAEGLSDAEWRAPVSATDRRSIGVIVHHVDEAQRIPETVAAAARLAFQSTRAVAVLIGQRVIGSKKFENQSHAR